MDELDHEAGLWVRRLAHIALGSGVLPPPDVIEFLNQVHVVAPPGSTWPRLVEEGMASLSGEPPSRLMLSDLWARLAEEDDVRRAAPYGAAVGRLLRLAGQHVVPDAAWLRQLGSWGPWDLGWERDDVLGTRVQSLRIEVEARQEAIDEGYEAPDSLHEDLLASVPTLLDRLTERLSDADRAPEAG